MEQAVLQLIMAAVASLGFGLFFNLRRGLLGWAALGGFMSWAIYLGCAQVAEGVFLPCLVASAASALYAEVLGRRHRAPSTIFFIVAVIPLVPGRPLFYTMASAVRAEWPQCYDFAMLTLQYAAAIAIGISLVWAAVVVVERIRAQRAGRRRPDSGEGA